MATITVTDAVTNAPTVHTQTIAAAVWTVNHNLGRHPIIELFTVGGVQMLGRVTNLSVNTLQVDFNSPIAGTARMI